MALTGFTATAVAQAGKGLADFNVAAEKDLLALPHLNAELTKKLLDQRPFLSITNVDALLGASLTTEQRTELYGKAFIHVNLNTAPRAELLLIPNLGNRMAHEFEEYRPYRAMAQFRREMGKYVNNQEVARLEQYVFIPVKVNTASDEDIVSIPGVGPRMLHEFKEYRPYRNIEQFRREIGKYVNPKELARLERYVVLE
jgi:DNA uptake protein ComE-like DNA-binding protein